MWDIGCDHGHLGLSLVSKASLRELHLVDPSHKVITDLKKIIDSYITKETFSINIHEKKGQDVRLNPQPKTIYIAGMGGEEIKEIIQALSTQLTSQDLVVISPHRKILELRKYLRYSDFRLIEEEVLLENGQYYQILALTYGGEGEVVTSYGSSMFFKGVWPLYKEHQLHHFKLHKDPESMAYFTYLAGL